MHNQAAAPPCSRSSFPVLPPRAGDVTIRVAAGLVTLLYGVELVAKSILQTYYPLSILGTASGNRLTDYAIVFGETG